MDPGSAELISLTTLAEVLDWVGIDGALRAAVMAALGEPVKVRELALVPRPVWDTTIAGITLPSGDGRVPLSPIQQGRAESLRRVANLLCLLPADDRVGSGGAAGSAADAPGSAEGAHKSLAPGLALAPTAKRVKLSSVIDQTCDAEVCPVEPGPLRKMYADYRAERGGEPSADAEASAEQIGAVQALVQADQVPYVDFAIFRPHGKRLLRKLTFIAHIFDPASNTLQKTELPGPADLDAWWCSWKVLRTILLFLHAVTTERLENYAEFIRDLVKAYGPTCWWIIYQADVRMRSEHMERIRRRLELKHDEYIANNWNSKYRRIAPWDSVFEEAVLDSPFWDDQVRGPAVLYLAKIKSASEIADDGTAFGATPPPFARAQPGPGPSPGKGPQPPPPLAHPAPRPGREQPETFVDRSIVVKGVFTHNRRGTQICPGYNAGACGDSKKPHGVCPQSTGVHQCNRCLGPHAATDSSCPGKPKGKGKGKKK